MQIKVWVELTDKLKDIKPGIMTNLENEPMASEHSSPASG